MAKCRCSIFPLFALFLVSGGIWALLLWIYDRHAHARMLSEIDGMRDFLLQYTPKRTVTRD